MRNPSKKTLFIFFFIAVVVLFAVRDEPVTQEVKHAPVITHAEAISYADDEMPKVEEKGKYEYIEITNSCGPEFEGHCIPAYSGPGTDYKEVADLRNGMVLKIKKEVRVGDQLWYQVYFDEWLRYPDRVTSAWYVPAVAGRVVRDDGTSLVNVATTKVTNKRILVHLREHMLYAYDGDSLYFETKVATGVDDTPTPTGTFHIYKKTPSRYMQGPLPGVNDNPFDLPGVPWNLYFTESGAVIHGSYWHDRYGTEQSSGCINLPGELARLLYEWAPLGTEVIVTQ